MESRIARLNSRQDISVLLVDDDRDLRQYWGNVLGRAFYRVSTTDRGIDALMMLQRDAYDVVLYDMATPDLDGLSFCRDLSSGKNASSSPVILYSADYIRPADRDLAISAGAAHFIARPANIDNVIRLVREAYTEQRAKHAVDKTLEPPTDDHDGHLTAIDDPVSQHLSQEVSLLRRQVEQLEHKLARYQAFSACATDYVWEINAQMQVTFFQASDSDVLGLLDKARAEITLIDCLSGLIADEQLNQLSNCLSAHLDFSVVLQDQPGNGRAIAVIGRPFSSVDAGFAGFRGTLIDVTDSRRISDRLQFEATHDSLTGLANARSFEQTLTHALADGHQHVLCYLDLDYFKAVNDTSGHQAGDELLRELTQLFQTKVRNSDCLARLGGDEFAILLRNCNLDQARRLVQDLHNSVSKYRFNWQGRSFEIGLSIGLVRISDSVLGAREVLSFADEACYAAKKAGRNQLHVYGEDDGNGSQLGQEAFWLERFHTSMRSGGLCLFRQPIVHANGRNKMTSYEVLVRMREGNRLVSPGDFLPVIERYQMSSVLDEWVIQRMLEYLDTHGQEEEGCDYYSINISGVSLCKDEFRDYVLTLVTKNAHLARRLCFEITESSAIDNLAMAVGFMSDLRALGCRFSLDDFGTGFSSLAYLKNLPVDYLKIDGVFITGVTSDAVDMGMLESIQHIASALNLKTIAEYVENEDTALALRQVGVDFLQGYYIGHPEIMDMSPLVTD